MKNKFKALSLAASLAFLASGCWQKAIHPFYTEKDLMANPALAADWVEIKEEGKQGATWTFAERGSKKYLLSVVDGDERKEFDVHFFKLRGGEFADFYSRRRGATEIPAHNLLKVDLDGDTLKLSAMSIDWVRNWLSVHPKEMSYIRVDDPDEPDNSEKAEFVLTGGTEALQKFVLEHRDQAGFFNDPMTFKRKSQ